MRAAGEPHEESLAARPSSATLLVTVCFFTETRARLAGVRLRGDSALQPPWDSWGGNGRRRTPMADASVHDPVTARA